MHGSKSEGGVPIDQACFVKGWPRCVCAYRWRDVSSVFFLYPPTVWAGGPSLGGLAVAPSGSLRVRSHGLSPGSPRLGPDVRVSFGFSRLTDHVFGVCSLRAPASPTSWRTAWCTLRVRSFYRVGAVYHPVATLPGRRPPATGTSPVCWGSAEAAADQICLHSRGAAPYRAPK